MNQRRLSAAVLTADLVWSVVAMGIALILRYGVRWNGGDEDSALHLLPFLGAGWLIWTLLSLLVPLDGFRGGWRLSALVSQLLLAVSGLMLILLAGGYLFRSYVSRLALAQFGLFLFAGFVLLRIAAYLFLRARLRSGRGRRIVILGSGRLARELARKFERHPEMLCQVVGFLASDDGTSALVAGRESTACYTSTLGIVELLAAQQTEELIMVLDECASPDLLNLAALCRDRGIRVSLVPQLYGLYLSRFHLVDLDGLPLLQLAEPGLNTPAWAGKRVLDVALGTLLGIASVPILLPLAIALRSVKGKAFRWETRCGFRGKPFAMLRLNVDRPLRNESRFEAVLGKFSLTELPQLWNVLRGDMSLVGPRPESRDRVCRYSEWQQQRLTVKPGMTGLAQVQGLREQHSSEEKTRFDLQYLLNCSLWTDLSLLLQTVWTLATRSVTTRDNITDAGSAGAVDELVKPPVEQDILENAHRS
jgi:lipopolysaccharide/colanic/teichoic acid biosynthesis glycosyltransferase